MASQSIEQNFRRTAPQIVQCDVELRLAGLADKGSSQVLIRLIRFLKAAFGATEASCQRNADQTVMHAERNVGNSLVMLGQAGGDWKALPAALYMWVSDVDATYERAHTAGATSQSAPEDKPYGHRNAGVVDENGITWWIGSPIAAR